MAATPSPEFPQKPSLLAGMLRAGSSVDDGWIVSGQATGSSPINPRELIVGGGRFERPLSAAETSWRVNQSAVRHGAIFVEGSSLDPWTQSELRREAGYVAARAKLNGVACYVANDDIEFDALAILSAHKILQRLSDKDINAPIVSRTGTHAVVFLWEIGKVLTAIIVTAGKATLMRDGVPDPKFASTKVLDRIRLDELLDSLAA